MALEVEVKARVNGKLIREKLSKINLYPVKKEKQVDVYFHHPCRDFKLTDEAIRVRKSGGKFYLTYKGPKIDLDTKSREEIQLQVKGDVFSLLEKLGFVAFEKIVKERELYQWEKLNICLDQVEKLGSFVEIEGKSLDEKGKIFYILNKLGIPLNSLIRKSYLELKLENTGKGRKNE